MKNWERRISYELYDSKISFDTEYKKGRAFKRYGSSTDKYFNISCLGLSLYTAIAMVTNSVFYTKELKIISQYHMKIISTIFTESNKYLVIDKNKLNVFRDFSKTAFYGQIAQGINYYFAKERRFEQSMNIICMYDFRQYIGMNNITYSGNKKTPDFVFRLSNNKIGLMESKGYTARNNLLTKVDKAIKQCESGYKIITGKNLDKKIIAAFATIVNFTDSAKKQYTKLHCIDPKYDDYKDNNLSNGNESLFEYSKFFYLAGDFKNAEKLKKMNFLNKHDLEFSKPCPEGYIIGEWNFSEDDLNCIIQFGITFSLEKYLTTINKTEVSIESFRNESIEIFRNGTFLKIVNNI